MTTETIMYMFTAEELLERAAFRVHRHANQYREEASLESLKASADRAKVIALDWAADQLDKLAGELRGMPTGELRDIEVEDEPEPEPAEVIDIPTGMPGIHHGPPPFMSTGPFGPTPLFNHVDSGLVIGDADDAGRETDEAPAPEAPQPEEE